MVDEYGIFSFLAEQFNKLVQMYDSFVFFGLSAWQMMISSFVITLIIPFLWTVIIPSAGGESGFLQRGANSAVRTAREKREKLRVAEVNRKWEADKAKFESTRRLDK